MERCYPTCKAQYIKGLAENSIIFFLELICILKPFEDIYKKHFLIRIRYNQIIKLDYQL